MLSKSAVSLIRLPEPAQPKDYEEASREIEDLLRALPGIHAVYRTGSISTPGISDIDRIAVVEGEARVHSVWPKMSETARRLAMHGPFLIDRSTFRRHRWFAYMEPLELSHGESVPVEDRPLPSYSERLIAAESLVVSLLTMVKQLSTGLVKVRPALCQLNNLRHALALARLSEDEAPSAWQVAADVTALRNVWFESADAERLNRTRHVSARAVPALLEALWRMGERTGGEKGTAEVRLGQPWANVTLAPSQPAAGNGLPTTDPVSGTPRLRLRSLRSARFAEFAWRAARPRVSLHAGVLDLIAGSSEDVADFRSSRDELVCRYRDWLRAHGPGYAEIGLASPFLPTAGRSRRARD